MRAIDDFKSASEIGAKHLFLVQDNFLNDRLVATSLCLNLADLPRRPSWNCYGTLRDLDAEMAEYLARGGCTDIYIGIDAATPMQMRQFAKSAFKNVPECREKISALVKNGITPTCAFIVDALNWDDEELEATFSLALELRLIGCELSLHFLTTYSGTELSKPSRLVEASVPDEYRIRLMFDCPEVVLHNPLVGDYPTLFPFHTRNVTDERKYRRGVALVFIAQHLLSNYAYELHDLQFLGRRSVTSLIGGLYESLPDAMSSRPEDLKIWLEETFERSLTDIFGFTPVKSA